MKINEAGRAVEHVTDSTGKEGVIPAFSADTSDIKVDAAGKGYVEVTDDTGRQGIAPVISILGGGSGSEMDFIAGKNISIKDNGDGTKTISSETEIIKIVPVRPTTGEENIFYLVPDTSTETDNLYVEWFWVDNKWEKIGSKTVDLSGYQKELTAGTGININNNVVGVNKAALNLDKVDNTSDLEKPISTATQTALNKLPIYEEGTWIPTIGSTTTNGVAVYTTQTGSYRRIGNFVSVSMTIEGTFTTKPVGQPVIRGLPFIAKALATARGMFRFMDLNAVLGVSAYTNYCVFRILMGFNLDPGLSPVYGVNFSDEKFAIWTEFSYHI